MCDSRYMTPTCTPTSRRTLTIIPSHRCLFVWSVVGTVVRTVSARSVWVVSCVTLMFVLPRCCARNLTRILVEILCRELLASADDATSFTCYTDLLRALARRYPVAREHQRQERWARTDRQSSSCNIQHSNAWAAPLNWRPKSKLHSVFSQTIGRSYSGVTLAVHHALFLSFITQLFVCATRLLCDLRYWT